jgi:myo-inositol-1(or 4)-monophosphatase
MESEVIRPPENYPQPLECEAPMSAWNTLLPEVERIARLAGDEVLRYFRRPLTQWSKANPNDVVTEADHASEAIILPALRALLPDTAVLSEESGASGSASGLRWVVDPIDGTTNFAAGLPHFSISIALTQGPGDPVLGVVYDPFFAEMFSAERGRGARLNGEPIHVTATPTLELAVLISGFSTDLEIARRQLRDWEALMGRTRALRRLGSAALDLAYVAAGRVDGFWELHLQLWDVMAGLLLVQEAGGRVTDRAGGPDRLFTGDEVIASNGALHDSLLEALSDAGRL